MRVIVAGATGALGRPLVRMLRENGHEVVGITRSDGGAAALKTAGATAVVADALLDTGISRLEAIDAGQERALLGSDDVQVISQPA